MTDELEPNEELDALRELVRRGEELEREIEAKMTALAAAGMSQRTLADALGTSKSTINRRLSSTDVDGDDAIAAERLKLHRVRVAKEAGRLAIQRDQAALIAEANSMTAIGPLDVVD
jgi:IS30 family transposase